MIDFIVRQAQALHALLLCETQAHDMLCSEGSRNEGRIKTETDPSTAAGSETAATGGGRQVVATEGEGNRAATQGGESEIKRAATQGGESEIKRAPVECALDETTFPAAMRMLPGLLNIHTAVDVSWWQACWAVCSQQNTSRLCSSARHGLANAACMHDSILFCCGYRRVVARLCCR